MPQDKSNGYEALASLFLEWRSPDIGVDLVRNWARSFAADSTVLDLGCGSGFPVTQVLIEEGLSVCGVDASPTLIEAFRRRFPGAVAECATVEDSKLLEDQYDGVIAVGLIFLLAKDEQAALIGKMAKCLKPRGKLVFTAPSQVTEWDDIMTHLRSFSLGAEGYEALLKADGLSITGHGVDEGENFYYFAARR